MTPRAENDAGLSPGSLSKEFFGDGASLAPGQAEGEKDGTASLFGAIVGSASQGGSDEKEVYSLYGGKPEQDFGPDYSKRSWLAFGGGDDPQVNPYAAEQDRRYSLDPRAVKLVHVIIIAIVCYVLFAILLPSASYNMAFSYSFNGIITGVQENVEDFLHLVTGYVDGALLYKMCTYGIYVFAGAALAVTGAVYQGSLKNALVSPTTLGVNAGGTLGITLFVLLVPVGVLNPLSNIDSGSYASALSIMSYYDSLSIQDYLLVVQGRSIASIVGCFVVVGLVMLVAHLVGRGRTSGYALIICGQVVALVASSVVEFIRYYVVYIDATGVKDSYIRSTQAGAISSVSTPLDLAMVALPCTVGIAIILLLRRKLNLLAFSDEEARSMGIATERLRWVMVGVCTFITAIVISFCGNVGFVGFSIPLIVRRYVGPDFNYLIPVSAALGSAFLLVTYWLADFNVLALFRIDIPISVNMITSLIGLVMFVMATVQQRRMNRSADWL